MRVESSVTAITWLPFAALDALPNMPLGFAVAHYDEPPGDRLTDIDGLREADAFREANDLRAWIEVDGGEIVAHGDEGRGVVAGVGLELGPEQVAFPAVEFPVIRPDPEIGERSARFTQTVGGRIGLPAPRPIQGEGYFHFGSALAWTTLELVLHATGEAEGRLVASSPFPRHSVYDAGGRLIGEHGLKDFDGWYRESFGESTPWGDEDAPEVVAAVEARLEDELTRIALMLDAGCLVRGSRLARRSSSRASRARHVPAARRPPGRRGRRRDGRPRGAGAVLGELAVLGDGRARHPPRAAGLPGRRAAGRGARRNRSGTARPRAARSAEPATRAAPVPRRGWRITRS